MNAERIAKVCVAKLLEDFWRRDELFEAWGSFDFETQVKIRTVWEKMIAETLLDPPV